MVVNAKLDYEMRSSKRMSSAPSLLPAQRHAPAMIMNKSGILKRVHLNQVKWDKEASEEEWQEDVDVVASPRVRCMEFQRAQKKENGKQNGKKNQYHQHHQCQYQYGHSGQQQPQHGSQQQHKSTRSKLLNDDSKPPTDSNKPVINYKPVCVSLSKRYDSSSNNMKQKRQKKGPDKSAEPHTEAVLMPIGRVSKDNRVKHPRLNGADLYVVRLGKPDNLKKSCCSLFMADNQAQAPIAIESIIDDSASEISDSTSLSSARSSSGSLHDELINPTPRSSPSVTPNPDTEVSTINANSIRASRPCYRCIEYMHSVGIKRVFWTEDGSLEWRSAKVRDLVAVLDGNSLAAADGGEVEQMFVTKHELLMLRRCMDKGKG